MGTGKVPELEELKTELAYFNGDALISQPQRRKLLSKLKAAFVFIRDYDKPPQTIIERERFVDRPKKWAPYEPTVDPHDASFHFVY